ncbi:MAG: hypothetical protein AAB512_03805 [Patescibacteria group bacterium]
MKERGAVPHSVAIESSAVGDVELRPQEPQDRFQLRPRKRVRAIGALTASVLALGITLSGCTGGDSSSERSETPSIKPSVTAQKTPEVTVTPEVGEVTPESINLLRKIDGKNWDEAISDGDFTYSEVIELKDTDPGKRYLRLVGKFGVYVSRKDNKSGEVKDATDKRELFDLIFPENPESKFPDLPSGRIKKVDGWRVLAYLVASDQNVVTEMPGLGVVEGTDPNIVEVKIGWRDFYHCGPTDTSLQKWIAYIDTTGYGLGETDFEKQLPIVQVSDVRVTLDDKICLVTPSR